MSKARIPKPRLNCEPKNIPKPSFLPSKEEALVVFSFASLEWTEYFNLEGLALVGL